jgi:hypothetical protein
MTREFNQSYLPYSIEHYKIDWIYVLLDGVCVGAYAFHTSKVSGSDFWISSIHSL